MRKKVLSILMCVCMTALLLAGCKKNTEEGGNATPTAAPTQAAATSTPAPTAAPASTVKIPESKYYFSFDQSAGTNGIKAAGQFKTETPIVQTTDKEVTFVEGVKGDALYCGGAYGYKLTEVQGVGETYTLSFWVNAARLATYMPTIQFGPDIHGDLTGGQYYLNITRTEWSGTGEFPCIWSYDQNGSESVNWPAWAPGDGEEPMKQWVHLTLVVDENDTTDDGTNLYAKLYKNGTLYGENITIVPGTMSASDNFEFLIGVNYWDSIFKGAIDELYIFDKVLSDEEIAALYADGNAQATYTEPERIIEVKASENAIESIGSLSLSNATDYSSATKIADGQTIKVTLKNFSSGKETTDNYGILFGNAASEIHNDPRKADGYKEYGFVRADATGEGYVDAQYNWSWGNWNTWKQSAMVEADVTLNITREADTITIVANNVDYNTTSNDMTAVVKTTLTAADDCYFVITSDNAYVDLLTVKDVTVRANAGITVGNEDRTTGWWTSFSPIWKVNEGETRTIGFTNYTNGEQVWNNFVAILQTTPSGHSADTEGYAEYAVVRADNFGWGSGYDAAVAENDADPANNAAEFMADMDGAHVTLSITNNGATADVTAVYRAESGKEIHQNYKGIATGGDLYFCLSCEGSYLQLDSNVVGNTDRTTGWWTQHSDIWQVPAGGTKSVSFRNYTNGEQVWNNFVAILQNVPGGHAADAYDGYAEYAVVRADGFGWGGGYDAGNVANNIDASFTSEETPAIMDGAYVDLTVKNNGDTADIYVRITTADGQLHHVNYPGIVTGGDLYLCLSCEGSYIVIDGTTTGATDNTTGWWTQHSVVNKVEEGSTEYVSFTNYSNGEQDWNNFVVILQTTPTGHSATTEGYAEYAVVRADNFGWGDGYTAATASRNWADGTIREVMDNARVLVAITNHGGTADIHCTYTSPSGKVYYQYYDGIVTGGDLYYCLSCEGSHITVD